MFFRKFPAAPAQGPSTFTRIQISSGRYQSVAPVDSQLTAVAAVAAVATVAGRVLRSPRLAPLRLAVWSAGALFLGWRFTTAGFSRMVRSGSA